MFTRLKHFFGNTAVNEELDSADHRVLDQLDIRAAQAAHENWKVRLSTYLDGKSNEDFSPELICFDDRCDLGRWIHGDAKQRLGKYPGFTALVGYHKMFHYAASNVVSLHQAGRGDDARKQLETTFEHHSRAVLDALDMVAQVSGARRLR